MSKGPLIYNGGGGGKPCRGPWQLHVGQTLGQLFNQRELDKEWRQLFMLGQNQPPSRASETAPA